jgi:serine/threonine protein kinase
MDKEEWVMATPVTLNPGDSLYKFDLKNRIGSGGFGDVWLAHDKTISKDVAVKVLDQGITINERLIEARIGNQLDHDNLVKMHYADVVQHNGSDLVIIAMDFHANGSVLSELNSGNFIPIPRAISLVADVLRGLEYLHELNLFHSDVKPGNILIGYSNQGVLTDYGITCHSPTGTAVHPRDAYKPHMAPEILSNSGINIHTDLYQTGLTAFRLLNGIGLVRDKFNKLGESDYYKLVAAGKVIRPNDYQPFIPKNLKTVINKAANVDPTKRFDSAVEMRRALERLSYSGYWTTDPRGRFVGYNDQYEFRFEERAQTPKSFEVTAYKKKISSGRETRIGTFSQRNLTAKEREATIRGFMQWVVTGES